ncbi:circular bacteriocin, circularin A/uberolysin family [Bacillus sp. S70]|jgi:circularin A/uberolysin family circular bacteriocin|uniref:Circularin A/uberolysin family circular bacteriocin n=1 Tax=Bacillus thuringiensis subsp. higo TaxID=132266 RepID=A0A9X6LTG0_BACUH|nr:MULTISPECIES: uberolysin/carnocyclin family circular bacteriocin [Bacillus]MED2789937.1 uberolysin/carnocyclin family circular bacteriocin [Bacillus thuringiensis]MBJ9979736.1 circular bacteriocin, circularin A/uberolysin family [Bacillus sp. S29]MBK0100914.1 circular bacteriocin, circularin A/uberolysin family [Bacillus sp. S70]MBK0105532.1 circular bacteriocin, circularin A/uberolysin family [Bacillus sp. S73]MBK0134363.1 circular bacteriocin, circularin A/uberolysin family [Bacillus sp. 
MNLTISKREKLTVTSFMMVSIIMVTFFGTVTGNIPITEIDFGSQSSFFATKLGLTQSAAAIVIDLINKGSTVLTIISMVSAVSGAGLIAAGGIAGIKYVIKKKGRDKAVAW